MTRNRLPLLALLGTLALLPRVRASAQEPMARVALRHFRDTLSLTPDTTRLLSLERDLIALARRNRNDAMLHIRLGFVALRLADFGGDSHVDDAASEFEWAASLEPDWPYPWLGLGLAESRLEDRARGFAGGLWTMVGADQGSRAAAAFAQSVRADATFVEGLVSFAQTAERQQINSHLDDALTALRIATASPAGWHPALLFERGRVERLVGDADSARVALERALVVGADSATTELELARTLPLTSRGSSASTGGDTPVERAYFSGAASDRPAIVAEYRDDLAPIADDSVLAGFDSLSGVARVAWLRDFWARRDAADLRPHGSRLAEHFRRWAYAMAHFRLPPFRRRYRFGIELFRSGSTELDDRGLVWIRQGAPSDRIIWPQARRLRTDTIADPAPLLLRSVPGDVGAPEPARLRGIEPARFSATAADTLNAVGNETWKYARADGDLILHFTARDDPQDYRLVSSVLDLDVGFDALLDQADLLPGLARMLRAGPNSAPFLVQEERDRTRRDLRRATSTDSWERSYPVPLTGSAEWLPAGVRDGLPLVHLVYVVDPVQEPRSRIGGNARLSPMHLRAAFLDSLGREVAHLDTLSRVAVPVGQGNPVAALASLPVPTGTWAVRLGLEVAANTGGTFPLTEVVVPDVSGRRPDASALLIGRPGAGLPWLTSQGDTAWISPGDRFSDRDSVVIHGEFYGLRPDTRYTVRLSLTRHRSLIARLLDGGGRDAITITEQRTFGSATGIFHRRLDLGGLASGSYRLELKVQGGGVTLTRTREIKVY